MPISGTHITVICQCNYYNRNGVLKVILAQGESHSVTLNDLNNCPIDSGKISNDENSCPNAKKNAIQNCQTSALSTQPGSSRFPDVVLDHESCYGSIQTDDETVLTNL